ncbi:hypothetical protein [Streptomyces sp. R44]|uniref:Secreted protein n=1 Tax=Streptomyces sp. R44 TaxID=3238633 RepID=A0AB39SZD9_9ACTN
MSIKTKFAKVGAVAAASAALAVLGSGSAFAGTNGQQLRFYDVQGHTYSIKVNGYDQNGNFTSQCFGTPSRDNYIGGWWWKWNLNWTGYSGSDCTGTVTVGVKMDYVEPNQAGDWWLITS